MSHRARTFDQARYEILDALRAAGWSVKHDLKIPHATSSDGELRLWFKAQAVHYTTGRTGHVFGHAHTIAYDFDIRQYSGQEFLAEVEKLKLRERTN